MVFSQTICVMPGNVRRRLRPDAVLRTAADGQQLLRHLADLAIGLEDVVGAAGDALEQRAIDVAALVRQVEAEDHALGMRDRGSASARRRNRAARPAPWRRAAMSPPPRRASRWRRLGSSSRASSSRNQWVSVPLVASPAIEACWPGNSHGAYHSRAVRDARFGHHDDEDGRAIHQHHVAGLEHADAERLGRRIDRAGDDRRARRSPVRSRRLRSSPCRRCRSSRQLRQPVELDDVGREFARSSPARRRHRAARSWPPSSDR